MSQVAGKTLENKENRSPQLKNSTIQLESSSDTDFIESSILSEKKSNFLAKDNWVFTTPSGALSPKTPLQNIESENNRGDVNISRKVILRSSSRNICRLENEESANKKAEILFETPSSTNANSVIKKLISTLKKTPEGPYLSKSKLRNIEQWLNENAVETVSTPPFANLSVTPVNSLKKRHSYRWKNCGTNFGESSLDSEVEGILKAVYGDDWKQKNGQRHARTEPKKKSKRFLSPVSLTKKKDSGDFYSVRRNILSGTKLNLVDECDRESDFDDSVVSGVKIINLNSSDSSFEPIEEKNFKTVQKENKKSIRSSSSDPLRLSSNTKRGPKIVPEDKASSQINRLTAKNAKKKLGSEDQLKTPKKTFLSSLSVSTPTSRCHPDAQYFKLNFKSKKEELVNTLYKLFNKEVFEGKLPEDMNFSWNVKLRGTAGFCYNKRITKSTGEVLRLSRIEFSTKIVDRADRLRDTMIHELCHASSWVIDGVLDGHGKVWSKWACRAMKRFPELPPIKRCHNYDIVSKYVYRCTSCGYSIKRHSKSINTERKRCGHCYGTLELLINKKKRGKGETPIFDTTRTLPTPNKFALFVKENYHSVKSAKSNAKHSEIMKTLSQQYALFKNQSKSPKKSLKE